MAVRMTDSRRGPGRSWRRLFAEALISPRSNDPSKRRPGDLAALIIGSAIVVLTAARVRSSSDLELQVALFFNRLPEGWSGVFAAVLGLGALWVVASMAGLGAIARRSQLSIELSIAGLATWLTGRVLADHFGRRRPPLGIRARADAFHQFPAVRVAVATAIAVAAAPYITRIARRLGWLIVAAIATAAAARGVGSPNDIVGALALGWAVGAGVHLVFGSPAGRPSLDQVDDALRELGVTPTGLRYAGAQEPGSTTVLAETELGPMFIRAYGRDERDAQLLSKLWRFVWYDDSGPTLYLTRLQQVEHEAYALLIARNAGVSVPEVLAAATAGPGTAVLIERHAGGVALSETTAEISDEVLDSTWRSVLALRRARIAHRRLHLGNLIVGADGEVVITDFTSATTMATDAQLDADDAQVIAATASSVGLSRAVDAARRNLPPDTLTGVLAYLQSPVLPDRTRQALRSGGVRLNAIRDAAAFALGTEPPTVAQLERVQRRSIAMAVATFVGVYVLFGQLGNFTSIRHELADAQWGWFALALMLAAATNVGYAMSYVGATNAHLPFGRTLLLQAAGSFTNVVTPNALGTAAINTRFLQVRGVRLGSAIASQVVNTLGSAVVQVLLFIAVVPAAGGDFDLSLVPWRSVLTFAVAVVAAAILATAITWRLPRARSWLSSRIRPALADVFTLIRSPAKTTLVVAGNVLVQLLSALALGAVCRGFDVTIPFSTLLFVNIGSSAIAGLVPAPGGLGVAEATLAGALAAAGVPSTVAVAASLTQRLVTTWLPPIPGWFALRSLQKGDDL